MSFSKKIRSNLPNSEVGDLVCVGEDSYLIDVDSYKISFCSSDIRGSVAGRPHRRNRVHSSGRPDKTHPA